MNCNRLCMDCAWPMDGVRMVTPGIEWVDLGLCMDYEWIAYGVCMDHDGFAWIMHELRWIMYGLCIDYVLMAMIMH